MSTMSMCDTDACFDVRLCAVIPVGRCLWCGIHHLCINESWYCVTVECRALSVSKYLLSSFMTCVASQTVLHVALFQAHSNSPPPTSTWPHLRCDVGLEEGEYRENCLCLVVLCTITMMHKDTSSSYRSVNCIGL